MALCCYPLSQRGHRKPTTRPQGVASVLSCDQIRDCGAGWSIVVFHIDSDDPDSTCDNVVYCSHG